MQSREKYFSKAKPNSQAVCKFVLKLERAVIKFFFSQKVNQMQQTLMRRILFLIMNYFEILQSADVDKRPWAFTYKFSEQNSIALPNIRLLCHL